jgi:hypothetical protein
MQGARCARLAFFAMGCSEVTTHVTAIPGLSRTTMQLNMWSVLLAAAAASIVAVPRASAFQGMSALLRVPSRNFGRFQLKSASKLSHVPSPRLLRTLGSIRTVATTSTAAPAMPLEKFRKDYKVPDYSIRTVDLTFKIFQGYTQVILDTFPCTSALQFHDSSPGRCSHRSRSRGALAFQQTLLSYWMQRT